MIDAHCHLSAQDYDQPITEVIQKALSEGVEHIMAVACDPVDWPELLDLLEQEQSLYGAIGIHPEYADVDFKKTLSKLPDLFIKYERIVAVGEIGLDYHEVPSTQEKQKELFYKQIELAYTLRKPIMIHTRDAEDDTINLLQKAQKEGLLINGGVIHCFTGTEQLAQFALDLGFYISASGVITFKNAQNLRDIFSKIPLDKLLVETDAPWLAPVPLRGKKNQPAYVKYTLEKLAEIKGIPSQDLERITNQNFNRLYLSGRK